MIFAVLLGLLGFIPAIRLGMLAVQKRYWCESEAIIVGVDIKNRNDVERRRFPHFIVGYTYSVEGVQYFGTDSIPMDVPYYEAQETTEKLVKEYQPGERIQIFFPESNPAISSARRGVVGLPKALFRGTALLARLRGFDRAGNFFGA